MQIKYIVIKIKLNSFFKEILSTLSLKIISSLIKILALGVKDRRIVVI